MSQIKKLSSKWKVAGVAVLALAMVFSMSATALADQDPGDCDANGVGLSLSVFRADQSTVISGGSTVESGETIYYRATLSHLGATNCNFELGELTITTPDSTPHEVTNPVPLVEFGNSHVSSFVEYVVSESDVAGGNITAEADYTNGISHTSEQHDDAAASVNRNTPYQDTALEVTKTAVPTAEETYSWTIDKSVTPDNWGLFVGNSGTSEYTVTLDKTLVGTTYAVSGTISIFNPSQFATAVVTDVSDVISGLGSPDTLNCPNLPGNIGPGATEECTYSHNLGNDSTARTNTATVTTSGDVDGGSSPAVDFDPTSATPVVVGGEVNVDDTFDAGDSDNHGGPFTDDTSYTYTRQFTCGSGEGEFQGTGNVVENTATIVETEQFDTADVTINCYDITVEKTADTTYTRTYDWNVVKVGDQEVLQLAPGQQHLVNYDITATMTGSVDSDWAVEGTITVTNPAPFGAEITGLSDVISNQGVASTTCPVAFPHTIAGDGGTLVCTYSKDLTDGDAEVNTATATLQNYDIDKDFGMVQSGTTDFSGSANVTFGAPSNEINETVEVYDPLSGLENDLLGTVTVGESPKTFEYAIFVGPYGEELCGLPQVTDNTATLISLDSDLTDEDTWSVTVNLQCELGCSLTQGYWKTHNDSFWGGAPTDDNWNNVDDWDGNASTTAELNLFSYDGGSDTWFDIFWTSPKGGNVWYQLAHQWMAAYLNMLNGADTSALGTALTDAQDWLEAHSPADKIKGKNATEAKDWASLFAAYNEGDIGPGHCDEDQTSEQN